MSKDSLPDVKKRFDSVANNYNKKLEVAKYFGHDHMLRLLKSHAESDSIEKKYEMLDMGCATGLCGQAFQPYVSDMDGIDLSEKMLTISRSLGIYRQLYLNDIVTHLSSIRGKYDLITAASVFLYFDDLQEVFSQTFRALKPGGLFIFTCDRHDDDAIDVQSNPSVSLLFTQSKSYIERCLKGTGFNRLILEKIDERLNWKNQAPVPALVGLAEK
jgi:predicted TPR repeat methyltransferase